jgi:hypothetical protein
MVRVMVRVRVRVRVRARVRARVRGEIMRDHFAGINDQEDKKRGGLTVDLR